MHQAWNSKLRIVSAALSVGAALCSFSMARAAGIPAGAIFGAAGFESLSLTPVVVFGRNSRLTVEQYAEQIKDAAAAVRQRHAASGLVKCGSAHGAGQVTVANDVITTAAHVFFDEEGNLRASSCIFTVKLRGTYVDTPINLSSIVAGSRNPYAIAAVHDWAVAKLQSPLPSVTPYELADHASAESPIEFVARGHIDWGGAQELSIEACHMHDQLNAGSEGTREFSFDCETGDGASGGALLAGTRPGKLCGVLVGYRSVDPEKAMAFSGRHYNFAVTVEGAFRAAVLRMAQPLVAAH